jgi:glyoxylase-like metal-dependent hydrolase (beta-lactamase superfamily II)
MFERVPVPTPFQIGPVNAYLAGRTVVDPGPDSEEAWSTLVEALSARELAPGDVERVLVTHPHPDHFGTARRLRDHGATVVAARDAVPILEDFEGRLDREQAYFRDFFVRCGMAESTAETVTDLPAAFVHYAPSVAVDRAVTDGDTLTVADREVSVRTLAGHATGEVAFGYGADERVAIVGDNVLPHITPNPFLQPPPADGDERPRVVPAYNESLATLRQAGYDRLLPGHRELIEDPVGRIDEILAAHDDRTETVAAIVDGPTTPVEVMESLFEDLPVTEQFPGMSEAVGHLDVLEAQGRVRAREEGGLLLYEPV